MSLQVDPRLERSRAEGRLPVVLVGGLNLTRCLGPAGVPVIYATADAEDIALSSRFVRGRFTLPPKEDTPRLARALGQAGEQLHALLGQRPPLFYGGDDEILAVAEHRDELARHYRLLAGDPDVDRAMLDKERCYSLMEQRGLRAPRGYSWEGEGGVAAAPGPVIIKPRHKINWRGSAVFQQLFGSEGKARIYDSGEALLADPRVTPHRDSLLIQDYIPGGDDHILSFHCLADEQSRVMASFCGRKIRTFPAGTGESSFIELIRHDELTQIGRQAVERLGLQGPVKIDTKIHAKNGAIYLMEVNTRFTIWNHLGAVNGINIPLMAYDYLVNGRRPRDVGYRTDRRWIEPYLDYRAYRELSHMGKLSLWSWLGSILATRRVQDVFSWDDPVPFVKDVWRLMQTRVDQWRGSV